MKKTILAGLLVIGAISFAANGTGTRMEANNGICTVTGTTTRGNAGTFMGTGMKSGKMSRSGKMKGNHGGAYGYNMMTPEQRTIAERNMISIQEKKLEVRKLMLEKTPDWKKIEKLNGDVATLQAKNRTEREKAYVAARNMATQPQSTTAAN